MIRFVLDPWLNDFVQVHHTYLNVYKHPWMLSLIFSRVYKTRFPRGKRVAVHTKMGFVSFVVLSPCLHWLRRWLLVAYVVCVVANMFTSVSTRLIISSAQNLSKSSRNLWMIEYSLSLPLMHWAFTQSLGKCLYRSCSSSHPWMKLFVRHV